MMNYLPILKEVDVLVLGGSAGGVALALACEKRGLSVFLAGPRPYLGDDICDGFRFWPDRNGSSTEMGRKLFGSESAPPPTPLHIKRTLEQALVEACIPFLLNSHPAGCLLDQEDVVCGAVIANRSGRQGITARWVVDATLDGRFLRQAGHTEVHSPSGMCEVEIPLLYEKSLVTSVVLEGEELMGFLGEGFDLIVRKRRAKIDFGDGSPEACARGVGEVFTSLWRAGEYRHPSWLTLHEGGHPQTAIDVNMLICKPGLLGFTETLRLSDRNERAFQDPLAAIQIATLVADYLKTVSRHPTAMTDLHVSCTGAERLPEGHIGSLPSFLRPRDLVGQIEDDLRQLPRLGQFDVVVVGGGTGGAPAGIGASRAGAKTLIIEITSGLGGVGTMGQIAKYWCGNRVGFTAEIDRGVNELEAKEHFKVTPGEWSIAAKSAWYVQSNHTSGTTIWLNTLCLGVWIVDQRVRGLVVSGPFGFGLVEAGCVVDSTGCSDIPAAAGAPTVSIGRDHVAVQGTGLAGIRPGRNYHNSDHNFSDDTDVFDTTAFLVSSRLKYPDDFDCGELIDSRERRQIIGDFTLQPVDVLNQRRFPDTICVATSNFDSHGFTIHPVFMIVPPDKKTPHWADMPFRTFLPKGLDGVLVTGLGLSAHRDVLPVVRMQADVQNQGYAAGVAAAMSARQHRLPLRQLNVHALQQHLVEIGSLPDRVLTDTDSFPVTDEEVKMAVLEGRDTLKGLALILSDPVRSIPLLKEQFELSDDDTHRQLRLAHILALMDEGIGEDVLIRELERRPWDAGWKYKGMGQFGMSMSEVDGLLVALGRIATKAAWPCLLEKGITLPESGEFSHCRALVIAYERVASRNPIPTAAGVLASLLDREGYTGHTQLVQEDVQSAISDNLEDNAPRNAALRELHLARGLYRCGDVEERGRDILRGYEQDLRGHFARHAQAVLAEVYELLKARRS